MKNDEVCKPSFLRHSTFLVHYSIFLFGSGLCGLCLSCSKEPPWLLDFWGVFLYNAFNEKNETIRYKLASYNKTKFKRGGLK
jgi:hypothetical protein